MEAVVKLCGLEHDSLTAAESKLETPSQQIAVLKTLAVSRTSQYSSTPVPETEAFSHESCRLDC